MALAAAAAVAVPSSALSPVAALAAPVEVDAPKVPGFADVIAAVSPAVVSVRVEAEGSNAAHKHESAPGGAFGANAIEHLFSGFGAQGEGDVRPVAQGSGFFISEDGYVVTNDDVVADGSAFQVVLKDGATLPARLVGEDARTDLAVLKVTKPDRKFTYVAFADDGELRIGDWIVAVGNPYGLGGTVTAGIVSGRGRDIGAAPYDDFIQFDAPVSRGDAGGPAFNLSGEVVGVNAALFAPGGGTMGIAYAIPASTAKQVTRELIENGSINRGWLGVALQPVTPDIAESVGLKSPHGALVADLDPNAPAVSAGVKPGEVITSVNGKPVKDPRDLATMIGGLHPGDTVTLGLWRDGNALTASATLAAMPSAKPAPSAGDNAPDSELAHSPLGKFGLMVIPAAGGKGVIVTEIGADSAADHRGLRPGDIIVTVDGKPVSSASDVVSAISAAARKGRKAALMRLEDGNRSRFIAMPINMG